VPITIKETIDGCGKDWRSKSVMDRRKWLTENLQVGSYKVWYGGLKSDDQYIKFNNEEDLLAYKIRWM
jgi:hypothetical protein